MTTVRRVALPLAATGVLLLIWAAWLACSGGVTFAPFGVRISADIARPLLYGSLLTAAGLLAGAFPIGRRDTTSANRIAARLAAFVSLATLLLGIAYGSRVAAGADAYGYVSQAALWRNGAVAVPSPLATTARWPDAPWSLTPLGYRPAVTAGAMVPIYPAGLPLTMAAAEAIGGERAAYVVVPLLGAVAVWLTFVLGRVLAGAAAGLLAAVSLVASPAFLFQLMLPMSDVPAMTWWLAAIVGAADGRAPSLVIAGVSTALAVLTRPNLVFLAIPVGVLVALVATDAAQRRRRVLVWGALASVGAFAVAVINARLYGSPLSSGYDRLDNLYSWAFISPNTVRYGGWLLTTQTPFIAAGVLAPWLLRRQGQDRNSVTALWALIFAAAVIAAYLVYLPFDNWTFLRFLLPAYPLLLVSAAVAAATLTASAPRRPAILAALALLLVTHGLWQGRLAFRVARDESRYKAAATVVSRLTPDAVVVSNLHSGSVRYYADRLTLRYEWLGADAYAPALQYFHDRGRPVYALLDEAEVPDFRARYAGVTDLHWMDAPLAVIANRVYLYRVP